MPWTAETLPVPHVAILAEHTSTHSPHRNNDCFKTQINHVIVTAMVFLCEIRIRNRINEVIKYFVMS
jgi:hypothetical protein